MIDRDRLRGALFAVVPRSHHIRLSRIMMNLETIVGAYIRGQMVTSVLMAVFTFLLLTACGVENALALAVFAGLADVLPYIGPSSRWARPSSRRLPRGPGVTVVVLVLMVAYEEFESRVARSPGSTAGRCAFPRPSSSSPSWRAGRSWEFSARSSPSPSRRR